MRLALLGLPALALVGLLLPSAAHADPYRWCAQYSERGGGGAENCGFVTLRQCQDTISGIGPPILAPDPPQARQERTNQEVTSRRTNSATAAPRNTAV